MTRGRRPASPPHPLTGGVGTRQPPVPPLHRSPFTGRRAWRAGSPQPPRLLPARPPAGPPLRALRRRRVGSGQARSTMWLLVPQRGRASWNWPVSCLGHRAFSKVNKQIRRSWGRGQKAGYRGTAPRTPAPWPQVAWSRERGTGRPRPHPLSLLTPGGAGPRRVWAAPCLQCPPSARGCPQRGSPGARDPRQGCPGRGDSS